MKENLLSAIKAHDFTTIRNICFALPEQEKAQIKKQTHNKASRYCFTISRFVK